MTAIDSNPHSNHGAAHGNDAGQTGHTDHGHGHSQYPFLAHHFESPAQQFDSGKLGMWVFLATEILFFGALFAMYAIMRAREPEVFSYAANYLSTIMGGINTCVLILSSLTMAMAVHFAQRSKRGPLVFCLFLTFLGACGFLVIKYFEYEHKIHTHLVWGETFYKPVAADGHAASGDAGHGTSAPAPHADAAPTAATTVAAALPGVRTDTPQFYMDHPVFTLPPADASSIKPLPAGPAGVSDFGETGKAVHDDHHVDVHGPHLLDERLPINTHRFFAIYYAMTGLHGIHVVVGMGLIAWLMINSWKGKYDSNYFTPVDLGGLYWHIVDLIWIFLFPLFYLIH